MSNLAELMFACAKSLGPEGVKRCRPFPDAVEWYEQPWNVLDGYGQSHLTLTGTAQWMAVP